MAVRDDGHVVDRGEGADPDQLGRAAAPLRVALDHAKRALFQVVVNLPAALNVFTGSDRDRRASAQLGKAADLFRLSRLFDPAGAVALRLFGPGEGVTEVPSAVHVEHQLGIIADGLANDAD